LAFFGWQPQLAWLVEALAMFPALVPQFVGFDTSPLIPLPVRGGDEICD
jgi:hypothetical protein